MRNLTLAAVPWSDIPQIEDITDKLPRHKKYTWETFPKDRIIRGVDKGGQFAPGFRPLEGEEVDTIIIHHSGPPAGGTIQGHANYHVNNHGWAGIAYHIVIDGGKIYQTNDLMSMTFHCGGNNTYTVGICINADLSQREMTSRERELLYAAILTVKSLLPIKQILGHNELNETACPCTSMNQIRSDIMKIEKQMEYAKSKNGQEALAYSIAQTILWTYNTAKGLDQYGKPTVDELGRDWARQRLLLLEPVMREHKFLQ